MRNFQKLPPHLTQSMSEGSKRDRPLSKAEPITDHEKSSGVTYLRQEKKLLQRSNCSQREYVRDTTLQTSQGQ